MSKMIDGPIRTAATRYSPRIDSSTEEKPHTMLASVNRLGKARARRRVARSQQGTNGAVGVRRAPASDGRLRRTRASGR